MSIMSTFLIIDFIQYPAEDKPYTLQLEEGEGALSRLDNDLCSMGLNDVSILTKTTDEPITINLDHIRIAQSGAVAVFGLLDWTVNNADGSVELQIANVGDCSAVLFSVTDEPIVLLVLNTAAQSLMHLPLCHLNSLTDFGQGEEYLYWHHSL
ncbi:hypothetical protein ACTXT7_000270 [Hymenolepis weldensis]